MSLRRAHVLVARALIVAVRPFDTRSLALARLRATG
jgi:hypothetical protein